MNPPNRGAIALFVLCLPAWAGDASSVPGVENFHQVNQTLYRGAQPTADGFRYLSSLGVKTIIDLREHDQRSMVEEKQVASCGMRYVNVPMSGFIPPTAEQIKQVLDLMENESAGPVFVHCKRGADRTGAVVAAYRIEHDHWENSKALAEAKTDHMSRFQIPRKNYILAFQARPAAATAATAAAASESRN